MIDPRMLQEPKKELYLAIYSHHRDRLGVYWRGRRKMCQVSPDIANHDDSKMKGDRSVLNEMNFGYLCLP